MKTDEERGRLDTVTRTVMECAFRVSNELGHGFLEKVYENALAIELTEAGLGVVQQPHLEVAYKGRVVGEYCPDIIVNGEVVLEIKAASGVEEAHISQCLNYLRVTNLAVGLVLNFGRPRVQYRRVVWGF
jgi:GxxExxY protein